MDNVLLVIFSICIVLRGLIFQNRDEKWIKTLIPFYNKYTMGKISDNEKLGVATAVISGIFYIVAFVKVTMESAIQEYVELYATETTTSLKEVVPEDILIGNDIFGYAVCILAGFYFILWVTLMRKFSILQQTTSWWMILWGLCPLVPYIYYTMIYKNYYIPKNGLVYHEIMIKKRKEEK